MTSILMVEVAVEMLLSRTLVSVFTQWLEVRAHRSLRLHPPVCRLCHYYSLACSRLACCKVIALVTLIQSFSLHLLRMDWWHITDS